MAADALYTSEVLELATNLADFGWDEAFSHQGTARSRSCGSSIVLGLSTDCKGKIDRIGVKCQACAIGQAGAAIFAGGATGLGAAEIGASYKAMRDWLEGTGDMPDWPGLAAICAARDYPGRHGAILLAWKAASGMLPTD